VAKRWFDLRHLEPRSSLIPDKLAGDQGGLESSALKERKGSGKKKMKRGKKGK